MGGVREREPLPAVVLGLESGKFLDTLAYTCIFCVCGGGGGGSIGGDKKDDGWVGERLETFSKRLCRLTMSGTGQNANGIQRASLVFVFIFFILTHTCV